MVSASSRGEAMALPFTARTTSPASNPAFAAGEPGETPASKAPLPSARCKAFAMAGLSAWLSTPTKPRVTRPDAASWSDTVRIMSEGIAKPMPIDPPVGEKIAVFMPITLPSWVNSGPPELPWLMGASTWMNWS